MPGQNRAEWLQTLDDWHLLTASKVIVVVVIALILSWLSRKRPPGSGAHCLIHPGEQAAHLDVSYLGFQRWVTFSHGDGPFGSALSARAFACSSV